MKLSNDALCSVYSFNKKDLELVKEYTELFLERFNEYAELISIEEEPNAAGICFISYSTQALGSAELRTLELLANCIEGATKK